MRKEYIYSYHIATLIWAKRSEKREEENYLKIMAHLSPVDSLLLDVVDLQNDIYSVVVWKRTERKVSLYFENIKKKHENTNRNKKSTVQSR